MIRAYRRHDIDKAVIVFFLDGSRGKWLVEADAAGLAVDVLEHVDDVLRIEGDGDVRAIDLSGNVLLGIADLRVVRGDVDLVVSEFELDGVVDAGSGNQGDAVDGSSKAAVSVLTCVAKSGGMTPR